MFPVFLVPALGEGELRVPIPTLCHLCGQSQFLPTNLTFAALRFPFPQFSSPPAQRYWCFGTPGSTALSRFPHPFFPTANGRRLPPSPSPAPQNAKRELLHPTPRVGVGQQPAPSLDHCFPTRFLSYGALPAAGRALRTGRTLIPFNERRSPPVFP